MGSPNQQKGTSVYIKKRAIHDNVVSWSLSVWCLVTGGNKLVSTYRCEHIEFTPVLLANKSASILSINYMEMYTDVGRSSYIRSWSYTRRTATIQRCVATRISILLNILARVRLPKSKKIYRMEGGFQILSWIRVKSSCHDCQLNLRKLALSWVAQRMLSIHYKLFHMCYTNPPWRHSNCKNNLTRAYMGMGPWTIVK